MKHLEISGCPNFGIQDLYDDRLKYNRLFDLILSQAM